MSLYILTDLDGTLLNNKATLSEFTEKQLKYLLAQGHKISYATARSYASSKRATQGIKWPYPVALYNGALMVDPVSESVIDVHVIPVNIVSQLIEISDAFNITPL